MREAVLHGQRDWAFNPSGGGDMEIHKAMLFYHLVTFNVCLRHRLTFHCGLTVTGDPLHSRALAHSRAPLSTQPCPHCSHSRAPGEQWARLCVFTLHGCMQAARLCRGSPVTVVNGEKTHQWRSCGTWLWALSDGQNITGGSQDGDLNAHV